MPSQPPVPTIGKPPEKLGLTLVTITRSFRLRILLIFGIVLGGIFCSPLAVATEVVQLDLAEVVRQSDAIVLGSVTAKQSRWGDEHHRWMLTDYTFAVEDVVYASDSGAPIKQTIVLTYWGGTIGGETQAISDVRLPAVGERLLVMLHPGWQGQASFAPTVGLNQGLFSVESGVAGSSPRMLDAAGKPLILEVDGQVVGRAADRRAVEPASFIAWLRSNIPSIKAAPSKLGPTTRLTDDRLMTLVAKTPALPEARGLIRDSVSPLKQTTPAGGGVPVSAAAVRSIRAGGDLPAQTTSYRSGGLVPVTNYVTSHQAYAPIVINNFPSFFAPWSPEDQYQMSKWNYYGADVFRVYGTPTGTYSWPDDVFDLDGWPPSSSIQQVYGLAWDANTIAVTFLRYDIFSRIVEADIALNPAFDYTLDDEWIYSGSSAQGFRQVMVHELGHMHGLQHQFNSLSVMNYMPSVFRFFSMPYTDDAEGIRFEYPGNTVDVTDLGVYLYYASGFQSVSDATYPSSVTAGGSLTVNNYQVENVGTNTISTPSIDWYLTVARNFGSTYYYLGTRTYSSLARFTSFTPSSVQATFTVPANVPAGNYFLAAYVPDDAGAFQGEFPFSNNYAFSRTTIQVGETVVTPPAPTGVTATAVSSTRVDVTWTTVADASFQIDRRAAGGGFSQIGTSGTNSFSDFTASADSAYLYRVRAVNASSVSNSSAAALATTVMFFDNPLTPGTISKAVHLSQLRMAVNAVRQLAGLSAADFTGAATSGTPIFAVHVTELRSTLDAARGALGLSTNGYTNQSLTGVAIKAIHFQELRNGCGGSGGGGGGVTVTTTSPLATGTQGMVYSTTLAATGGTGSYTWTVTSGTLPGGLTLGASTGTISGTPTSNGTFTFTVQATSGSQSGSKTFSLAIDLPGVTVTTTSPLPTGTQGTAYSTTLAATGGSGIYTWAVTSGTLPGGIALGASTGTISGTPTASGTFTFTVQATSGGQSGSKTFSLSISAQAVTITTSSPLTSGTQGTAYSRTLAATGGNGSYTWAVTSGTLPGGLSLGASTGTISGTPTSNGTFTFTAQATSAGQSGSKTFDLSITVPAVTISTSSPLTSGTQGTSYSTTLAATGGTGSYTWAVTSGTLPGGLSLGASTGTISGTPTANGTFTFSVQATSGGQSGSKTFSLTVAASVLPDLVVDALTAPSSGTIGGTISISMTVRNQGSAPAGAFRVGFYYSTNATITTADVYSGTVCNSPVGLGAGSSSTCSGAVTVPSSLTAGTYYLGAIADDLDQVTETIESNNARSAGPLVLSSGGCSDPAVEAMYQEYRNPTYSNTLRPACSDFKSSGGSTHFTWSELNDGWSGGSAHPPWGMVKASLTTGLEATRVNFGSAPIYLSSGYRCPHGNLAVGGVLNSDHTHGRAADMYSTSNHIWTEQQFNLLRNAALNTGNTTQLLYWTSYADRHLHAAW